MQYASQWCQGDVIHARARPSRGKMETDRTGGGDAAATTTEAASRAVADRRGRKSEMNNLRPAPTRGGGGDDTVGLVPSWERE